MEWSNKMDAKLKYFFGAMGCGKTRRLHGDYYSKKEDEISSVTMDGNIMVFHYGDGHTETLTINNLVKYESDDTILYEDEE